MTPAVEKKRDRVFLDACCLINLFASGRAEEILTRLPFRFAVARYVIEKEVLEIGAQRHGDASAPEESRIGVNTRLAELIERGVLEQLDVRTEEETIELVRFAAELDDGEAHTCALAVVRGARVATDDRKAIRVMRRAWKSRGHSMDPVLHTSDLLFEWARAETAEDSELTRIVGAIATRASFLPSKRDPHCERWMTLLQSDR